MLQLTPASRLFELKDVWGDLCPEARQFTHVVFHLYKQTHPREAAEPADLLENRAVPLMDHPDLISWLKNHNFFSCNPKTSEEIQRMIEDIIKYAPLWGLGNMAEHFNLLTLKRDVESAAYQYDALSLFLDHIIKKVILTRPELLAQNTPLNSFKKETFLTKVELWGLQRSFLASGLLLTALLVQGVFIFYAMPIITAMVFTPLVLLGTTVLLSCGVPTGVVYSFLIASLCIISAQKLYIPIRIAQDIFNYPAGWPRHPTILAKIVNILFFDIWIFPTKSLLKILESPFPKPARPIYDNEVIGTVVSKMFLEKIFLQQCAGCSNAYLRWRAISDITLNAMFAGIHK